MAKDQVSNQVNKKENETSLVWKTISTGFFGGFLAGLFGVIFSYFNFSTVSPGSFIIRSWIQGEWTYRWWAELIAVFGLGILSIPLAFIYFLLLKKYFGLTPGILFGLALWGIIYGLTLPLFPNIPSLINLGSDTIVTTICQYILFGVFVGYTISFDYIDQDQDQSNN